MRILQAVTTAAAVCLLYDCRFLHLLLSHKRIKLRIKLFPQSTKHTLVLYPTGDSITRGNGESTKKATAEIEPTDFWGTSGSVHRTQRLFFFRRKPRTLLIPLITEQSCWIPEQRSVPGCYSENSAHPQHWAEGAAETTQRSGGGRKRRMKKQLNKLKDYVS